MLVRLTDPARSTPVDQGLKQRSKKSTKVRAFAVAARPVGNTAHKSSGGRLQSDSTAQTAPNAIRE